MENKLKTLKTILTIGAVILLIAGISFQFASSIEDYVRVITMGLISGVFIYLSVYEARGLDYKSGSIVSHVFACVGFLVTFISIGVQQLLGEWFSFDGDGAFIFLACCFFLIALMVAISAVRYKIYKLIELSVWIAVIGILMIAYYYNADGYVSMAILLGVLLINNIFRMSAFSKWFTIGITVPVLLMICNNDVLIVSILVLLLIANLLFIILKERKTILIPLMITFIAISLYALDTINSTVVAIGSFAVIDFVLLYFKVYGDNKIKPILHKVLVNIFYVLLAFVGVDGNIKYVIPCIILISSLVNIYIIKDELEEYLLPFKAFYFVTKELYNIDVVAIEEYIILFAANLVNTLLYFFSKKKVIGYINLVIILLINAYAIATFEEALLPSIIYLVLFYLDFYIIYLKEEQIQVTLTVIYILYTFLSVGKIASGIEPIYCLASAFIYVIYIFITRKNKFIYCASIVAFIACISRYLSTIITNEVILGLMIEVLITMGIALIQYIFEKNRDKATAIGIIAGLQIGYTLLTPVNIVLKIYALVESICLILLSLIDDDYKSLSDEGIICVIASLLIIIGSIDNLPKSLYLIIIGLTIVITVPIFIKKYIKKIEEYKKQEALKPKEEVKDEVKPQPNKEYKLNYCSECGAKIEGEYIYCSKCGNKVR